MIKKKKRREHRRPKPCQFCKDSTLQINYKNFKLLRRYINERGKIVARRNSGVCARHQRQLAREIKRARFLALVPYSVYIYR